MRRIRLLVEYDGSGFSGWQAKALAPGGKPGRSVQDCLQDAVRALTGEAVAVVGAGRTDAGVHALGQVACFDTASAIPADRFAAAINSHLPEDIVVLRSEEAPMGFHPRRNAKRKHYRYVILNRPTPPAVGRERVAHLRVPLDEALMQKAAERLAGTHDFTSFAAKEATQGRNAVRTLDRIEVARDGDCIEIDVEGPGFLMHMIRIIVGSLIDIGRGKRPVEWISEALDARDRRAAGPTAPASGLTLVEVSYAG